MIAGIFALAFAQVIPTQVFAWSIGYPSWIGNPLIPGTHAYLPFEWPIWWFVWAQPLQEILHRPIAIYPDRVTVAFTRLWWWVGVSAIVATAITIVVWRMERARAGSADDLYDSGGRWAGLDDARKIGLLGKCGPIIGALEEARNRLLRYGGELGLWYIEPPGGGKSSFLQTNLTIPLALAEARKKVFVWWERALARMLTWIGRDAVAKAKGWRRWTDFERREHPWGEEPLILHTDIKFEGVLGSAGYQHDVLEKRTEVLAPVGVPATYTDVDGREVPFPIPVEKLACYNPFWAARIGTDDGWQDIYGKVKAVVDRMSGEQRTHWDAAAMGWGTAVVEHLAYVALNTGNYEMFSPCGLMDYLSAFREQTTDEIDPKTKQKKVLSAMDVLLNEMKAYRHDRTEGMVFGWVRTRPDGSLEPTRTKPSIFNSADQMLAKDPRERTSVWSSWIEKLNLFRSDALRKYTTRSTFEWKALANDPKRSAIVYLGTPSPFQMADLEVYTAMVVDDFLRDLTFGGTPRVKGRSVRPNRYPAILNLEEAYIAADSLPSMEKVAGLVRGYGIRIWLILQSMAQATKMFDKSGRENTVMETFDVHIYGATKSARAAEHIERDLGKHAQVFTAENLQGSKFALAPMSQVHESTQVNEVKLLTEKEITAIDREHYIVIIQGRNFYLRKSEFFKDRRLLRRSKMTPRISGEDTVGPIGPYFVRSVRRAIGEDAWRQILQCRPGGSAGASAGDGAEAGAPVEAEPTEIEILHPVGMRYFRDGYGGATARSIGEAVALALEAEEAERDAAGKNDGAKAA